MILITGATGFLGRALVRQLVELGYDVRVLIRPSRATPSLPRGIPVDVVVSNLNDKRNLQIALSGVKTVFHLAGSEWRGSQADLLATDIQGTQAITQAAAAAGVDRIFTVSHLGADRASAYPLLKTKGIAEEFLRKSGVDYTILRAAMLFGEGDRFTTSLAMLSYAQPFMYLLPGDGSTIIQPLWVEDLATCLIWSLDDEVTRNQVIAIGGPEYLSIRRVIEIIMDRIGVERRLVPVRPPYLRALTSSLETLFPSFPVSVFWLDYLAVNRTASLDTIPRSFGLLPSRFEQRLEHLDDRVWRRRLWRTLWRRTNGRA